MRKPNNSLPAQIEFIGGSSGTGKSTLIKERIAKERQVLVWDAKNEYGDLPGFKTTHDKAEFVRLARAGGRIAFAAPPSEFEFYCRVVWARATCLNIVEELGAVTGIAKACGTWHLIVSQGRGYGIRTIGIAQRTAEVDKTLIGNLSSVHIRRLAFEADIVSAAKLLNVPRENVASLAGHEFIERNIHTGKVRDSRGVQKPLAQNSKPAARVSLRKKVKKR